jgi:hypothetical protein
MEQKLLDINNEDLRFKIENITFESKIDYSDNVNIKSLIKHIMLYIIIQIY